MCCINNGEGGSGGGEGREGRGGGGEEALALRRTAWSEHGLDMVWARHGKCDSDMAALCK